MSGMTPNEVLRRLGIDTDQGHWDRLDEMGGLHDVGREEAGETAQWAYHALLKLSHELAFFYEERDRAARG